MFTLILIVLGQYSLSVTSLDFESSAACYKALDAALSFEKDGLKIKARCVAK